MATCSLAHDDSHASWAGRQLNHCGVWRRGTRWLIPLLIALLGVVGVAPDAVYANAPSFAQAIPFGAIEQTNSVAVGDFNGDGQLDIVQGNNGQSYIYLHDDHGGFTQPIPLGNREPTTSVVVGDFNGDGWPDIAQGNLGQSYVYLNDGHGSFTPPIPFGKHGAAMGIVLLAGDFNGDGWLDILYCSLYAANQGSDLYLNDGQGRFSNTGIPVGKNVGLLSIAIGDLDRDGWLDIIASSNNQTYAYLNDRQGGFIERVVISNGGSIAVGDFNGDGWLDIVQGTLGNGQMRLYLNDGNASFTQTIPVSSGDWTANIQVGDLNADGWLDIIQITNSYLGSMGQNYLYLNNGQGGFTSRISFGDNRTNSSQLNTVVGDLNGDGWLDIVQGNVLRQSYVYMNDGQTGFTQCTPVGNGKATMSVAAGDFNSDGWLDFVQGPSPEAAMNNAGLVYIYLNDRQGGFTQHAVLDQSGFTESIAVGDLNNDGWLDLVLGNRRQSYLLFGDGQGGFTQRTPLGNGEITTSVAVGDFNGDGWLDIIQGNESISTEHSYVYLNDGHGGFKQRIPLGAGDLTSSIAAGDFNGDGWLDIIQGNTRGANTNNGQSKIYLNDRAGNFNQTIPIGNSVWTSNVAVGDFNGDGLLDIVQGNASGQSYVYLNDDQGDFIQHFLPVANTATNSVAVGDFNGDGYLDIIQGNQGESYLYLNDGQGNFTRRIPLQAGRTITSLVVGDFNNDGLLDILDGELTTQSYLCWNNLRQTTGLVNGSPRVTVTRPGPTANANFFSSPTMLYSTTIPITYTLLDPESDRVGRIEAFYSPDGGGQWLPAVAARGAITQHLPTAPAGITYTFPWDTFASGFFGQSDNVVIRLVAYNQPSPAATPLTGGYRYTNTVPGPYLWPYASATTFPFRVRGTQVRVVDNNNSPVANALVYRLPRGTVSGAELLPNASQPLTTSVDGYLGGRGAMDVGDQLMAMAPISHGPNYTLYATSGIPNEKGLTMTLVAQAGVQTLQVSNEHPLLLFNLNVSLEWDASQDGVFYDQLKTAFERASAILYDVSDGQIALGEVRIHPNREAWLSADVVIYANNNLRPRATMGGLVETSADDVQVASGKPLKAAYTPGQVRMGPIWDPFGQNFAELTQDWQRALAHELAHYLLYLPDNYLGVEKGILRITNCQGSLMTDAYNPDYSEFLTPTEWTQPPGNPCLRTVAATLLTGRSDWATLKHFYPGLQIPQNKLKGPALLPLNVTKVRVIPPATGQTPPVAARNYDLRNEAGNVTPLRQAQAYVLQGQGTETTTDDSLLYLGSTGVGSDRILVRGAQLGDKVCVIDNVSEPVRAGCAAVTPQSTSIQVHAVAGWRPEIQVSPITSTTFQITVTQAGDVGQLFAQLLPAYGPHEDASAIRSVTQPLTPASDTHSGILSGTYTAKLSLPYPIFEGFVRVYSAQDPEQHQAISQFFLGGDWGPPGGWVGNGANRAWGANTRSLEAPVASGDGKVTILNLDDLLADTGDTTLQAVNNLPNLPPWLTAVGAGYRIQSDRDITRTLMFEYNQRDVPPGYEQTLNIYYLPANASAWQRLKTGPLDSGVDIDDNLATVVMPHANQGQGIYALLATVQLQPLLPGWNALTYPVGASNPVTKALASLDGDYTLVYEVRPNQPGAWPLYDRTVDPRFAPLVNTLTTMTFGYNYLIYATQIVTPYLPVVGDQQTTTAAATSSGLLEAPATFYGFVPSEQGAAWQAGMSLVAKIGAVTCGESRLQMWQGQLAYVIQVRTDNGDGCGQVGRTVSFAIDGKPSPLSAPWDNRQTHQILVGGKLYLPIVAR